MRKLFNKICIPIDFSENSRKSIENAVVFARQYKCSIHLLYVITFSSLGTTSMPGGHVFTAPDFEEYKALYDKQFEAICKSLDLSGDNFISIDFTVQAGAWDESIIDFVSNNKIDLVLIGITGKTFGRKKIKLNPDFIAEKANVAVVTIPGNRNLVKLGNIVIPITNFLPVRKLMYGIYLAIHFDTTIRLLGIENLDTSGLVNYYLKKSYQLIRDNSSVKVETQVVYGRNVAEVLSHFSVTRMADLIIVNPGAQTRMPGFFSSLIGNVLQKYSAPPVLSISPL